LCESLGCARVFNHRESGYFDELRNAYDGVDLVLEMRADLNLRNDATLVRDGGTIVTIGSRGRSPKVTKTNKTINMMNVSVTESTAVELETLWTEKLLRGAASGWLRPVIGKEFRLQDAAASHELIMNATGANGNVVLIP